MRQPRRERDERFLRRVSKLRRGLTVNRFMLGHRHMLNRLIQRKQIGFCLTFHPSGRTTTTIVCAKPRGNWRMK